MNRRAVLLAAGVALGAGGLAGCLEGRSDGSTATPAGTEPSATPMGHTESPMDRTATSSATPTERPSQDEASNEPDPDLPIVATNHHDVTHTVTVAVRQEGETLHEAAYELAPGDERVVFNLRETDPDGIESFTIGATLDDQTESVSVRTNACHGRVEAWIGADGDLEMTYSVC